MSTYATITLNGKTCKVPADRLQGIAFIAYRNYSEESENEYNESGNTYFYRKFVDMTADARSLYEFARDNK